MGLFKLHNDKVCIKYKSNLCSMAGLFTVVTFLIAAVFPIILAYRSRGFWLKHYTFYEQPMVQYKYEYLAIFETEKFEDIIQCGNIGFDSAENNECSYKTVNEIDYNYDGKIDELYIYIKTDTSDYNITAFSVYLIFDFRLQDICIMQMESMLLYSKDYSLPSVSHTIYGDLSLLQRKPLDCTFNSIDTTFNKSIFLNGERSIQEGVQEYFNRNVNTYLGNIYHKSKHGESSYLEVEIRIRIPELEVRYKPNFFQEMKWAWMQYFSLAIIFFFFFDKLKGYVFRNRLVMAWKMLPWEKKY